MTELYCQHIHEGIMSANRSRRILMWSSFIVAALAAATGCDSSTTSPSPVDAVRDLGPIGKPPKVIGRDGGGSGLIGGKILWLFGDTFWPFKSADGTNYRTNT